MTAHATDLTISKSILVGCSPERAFEVFTEGIDAWWPLATHSLGQEKARSVVFQAGPGGRIFEVWDDGSEHSWGEVKVWEPPTRVVYTWQLNPSRPATEIDVRFETAGDATRVELEHRGWERLGEAAAEVRTDYDGGWDAVLGRYAAHLAG